MSDSDKILNRTQANGTSTSVLDNPSTVFRKTHPLEFDLYNDDDQQVLYIEDAPDGQRMYLELHNTAQQAMEISAPSSGNNNASADNYNFALKFRHATLRAEILPKIKLSSDSQQNWSLACTATSDGTVSLNILSKAKQKIEPDARLKFTIEGLNADARGGARSTRMELHYNRVNYAGDSAPLGGTRIQHLSVANQSGKKNIPLHVGFLGSNTVLNDGQSENEIIVRITNALKDKPISLSQNADALSKFILSFDIQDTETKEWALMRAGELASVKVYVKLRDTDDWKVVAAAAGSQAESPEWIITSADMPKLKAGRHIQIKISGIKSSLSSGMSNLYIRYENIPGYWDGQFIAVLEKSNLVQRDKLRADGSYTQNSFIGIGTSSPQAKLHIESGSLSVNGEGTGVIVDEGNRKRVGFMKYTGRTAGLWRVKNVNFEIGRLDVAELPGTPDASKFTADLTIENDGRVRLGNTNTNAKLTIDSMGGTTTSLFCEHHGSNFSVRPLSSGGNSTVIENTGGGALLINPGTGNVGIGTVDAGANRLAVFGKLSNDDVSARQHELQLEIRNGYGPYGTRSVALGLLNNGKGVLQVKECNVGYNDLLLNPVNGNTGVGTSTPLNKLHVVASGGFGGDNADGTSQAGNVPIVAQSNSTAIGILNGNGRQAFALNIDNNAGSNTARGVPTFYDRYDGNWRSSLSLKNGNVGIGTADPGARLEVVGDAKVSGKIIIGDWTLETRYDGAWGSKNSALFITWKGRTVARFGTVRDMLQVPKYDGNGNYRGYFFMNEDGRIDNN